MIDPVVQAALVVADPLAAAVGCARIGRLHIADTVVMLMGIPGVGKSETTKRMHEVHGFTTLASEAVTLALFDRVGGLPDACYPYSASVFRLASRALVQDGHTLVMDSTHLQRSYRDLVRDLLGDLVDIHLLLVQCDAELAFDRASGRVTDHATAADPRTSMQRPLFDYLRGTYQAPGEDEEATVIVSDRVLAGRVDAYVRALKRQAGRRRTMS